jgi:hypothetical protein
MTSLQHRKRRIVIDDSDCGIPMKDGSAFTTATTTVAASATVTTSVPAAATANTVVTAPQVQMNQYFKQFPACCHGVLESFPEASGDAHLTDLRDALPPVHCQFLDMECQHMAYNSGDSSGETGIDSSSSCGSSFIDDTPVELTAGDVAYIALYTTKVLPMTAKRLLPNPQSPPKLLTPPTSKRLRSRVISSSSSGDDSDPVSQGARRHIDIRTEVRVALQQLPAHELPTLLANYGK